MQVLQDWDRWALHEGDQWARPLTIGVKGFDRALSSKGTAKGRR
jgi:hypothetical protein